jgi:hypothetical protein
VVEDAEDFDKVDDEEDEEGDDDDTPMMDVQFGMSPEDLY